MKSLQGKKLVLATHNQGKLVEIQNLLAEYDVQVSSSKDYNLSEPKEDGKTFEDNAMIKAKYVMRSTGQIALADDSGLCINALNGEPGIYSADWAIIADGTRDFNIAMNKINEKMRGQEDFSACFISVLALCYPCGDSVVVEGRVDGRLVWPPRGQNGFAYDSIFIPGGEEQTFAEMTMDEKKKYSHRARAFENLLKVIA